MRPSPNPRVERWRTGLTLSKAVKGTNNGNFVIKTPEVHYLFVIASDGEGWDHVSVSVLHECRCPTWEEMCFVKDLFWLESEPVMQLHPAKDNYVNNHPRCLHLWRPQSLSKPIPLPDPRLVGIHGVEGLEQLRDHVNAKEQEKFERTVNELQQASQHSGWGW